MMITQATESSGGKHRKRSLSLLGIKRYKLVPSPVLPILLLIIITTCGCAQTNNGGAQALFHIDPESGIVEIKDEQHFSRLKDSRQTPLVVNIYQVHCPPCRKIAPIYNKLAREYKGKILFAQAIPGNIREHVKTYDVFGTPTLLFFRNGALHKRLEGAKKEEEIRKVLTSLLK